MKSIFILILAILASCINGLIRHGAQIHRRKRTEIGAFKVPEDWTGRSGSLEKRDKSRPVFKSNLLRDLAPKASVAYQQSLAEDAAQFDANSKLQATKKKPSRTFSATDASTDKEKPNVLWTALAQQFKDVARQWFIERAENSGVPWTELVQKYENEATQSTLMELAAETEDVMIEYPDYYTQAFHGYDEGNLNWPAAMEGEAASLSMCVNYWKSMKDRGPHVIESWVRGNTTAKLVAYLDERGCDTPHTLLDVGSSVGVSTQYLQEAFSQSRVAGLDLSPYFVAMATYRARTEGLPMQYIHADAEHTGLPTDSVDVVTVSYMFHEVPTQATNRILSELHRILKPGGVILICDVDGQQVRDNFVVSSFRKWAFEVTEPHIYQYYQNDLQDSLRGAGFDQKSLVKTANDPINALWFAQKSKGGKEEEFSEE